MVEITQIDLFLKDFNYDTRGHCGSWKSEISLSSTLKRWCKAKRCLQIWKLECHLRELPQPEAALFFVNSAGRHRCIASSCIHICVLFRNITRGYGRRKAENIHGFKFLIFSRPSYAFLRISNSSQKYGTRWVRVSCVFLNHHVLLDTYNKHEF